MSQPDHTPSAASTDDQREFTQIAVEELEVLLAIAAEYRKIAVSDGRPRMRKRKLMKQLEVSRAQNG